jgi:hypothetical protein
MTMAILDADGNDILDPSGVTTLGKITAGNEVWEDCKDLLDEQEREANKRPAWHKDVKIGSLMCWQGHWFTFYGIDPEHDPDVIMFKWKEPTKATKRRENGRRTKNN